MNTKKIDLVSIFYVGATNTLSKIGETSQRMQAREYQLAKKEKGYHMLACLYLFRLSRAERRYIESYVRMKMENYAKNVQNDHFKFKMTKQTREIQQRAFAVVAMGYAIECCIKNNFNYYFTWVK